MTHVYRVTWRNSGEAAHNEYFSTRESAEIRQIELKTAAKLLNFDVITSVETVELKG